LIIRFFDVNSFTLSLLGVKIFFSSPCQPLQSIAELLLDPYYKGKQKFSFVEANRKKDREFGDLFSGYWMEYIQVFHFFYFFLFLLSIWFSLFNS